MELWVSILGSSAVAAAISGLVNLIIWWWDRKAAREDSAAAKSTQWQQNMEQQLSAVVQSQRTILLDRIKYLGQAYIRDGAVDFDDRRLLHNMHAVYHSQLGGNGDLDLIIKAVDSLPLKDD